MLPPRGETVLPPSGEGELPPVLLQRGETVSPPSGEGELPPSGGNVYISERKKTKRKKTRKGKQIYLEEGTRRVQWRNAIIPFSCTVTRKAFNKNTVEDPYNESDSTMAKMIEDNV